MWRGFVPRWRTAVKSSSRRILLVIYDECVNSTGVDLSAECTHTIFCVSRVHNSVLEVPNLSGRSSQIG